MFRWTKNEGMVGLGELPGGLTGSSGRGISGDGSVRAGDSASENGIEAFRWTAVSGIQAIGDLVGGSFFSRALGISSDSLVIVGTSQSANGPEAFRWTAQTGMLGIGGPSRESFFSQANAVSADGSVIVGFGYTAPGSQPIRWTVGGGPTGLGSLIAGESEGEALGVSADGSVVVGFSTARGGSSNTGAAFYWTQETGIVRLSDLLISLGAENLAGWRLTSARAVSADGTTIVGSGINPNRDFEAWMAIIPEPCAFSLAILPTLALIAVVLYRRR
jgi:probable HAF family extracellular repeat protein